MKFTDSNNLNLQIFKEMCIHMIQKSYSTVAD